MEPQKWLKPIATTVQHAIESHTLLMPSFSVCEVETRTRPHEEDEMALIMQADLS